MEACFARSLFDALLLNLGVIQPHDNRLRESRISSPFARWPIGLVLIACAGCLPIPHRHTEQPGARFHVTDEAHHGISGATVAVYEGSIIGGQVRRLVALQTDSSGYAALPRRRSWHLLLILIPDAEAPSVYGWCAGAAGHAPIARAMEDEPSQEITAPLPLSSLGGQCPAALDRRGLEHGKLVSPAV